MVYTISLTNSTRKRLESLLKSAKKNGNLQTVIRIKAIFAVTEQYTYKSISEILKVSVESIRLWVMLLILKGPEGLISKKKPGRPSKLTKKQKKELSKIIDKGPTAVGFPGACWRSPMIQELIFKKYNVLYSVFYIAQLLKNMGFSFQKAKFSADKKDPEKRKEWLTNVWPEVIKCADERNAHILFSDEASFPQWGTLSYTWARKGVQPIVKTSGIRKGYKVFGAIDYFTGKFFYKCHEKKLNSDSYILFLKEIIKNTRKFIILIHDGAPYHKSSMFKTFLIKYSHRIKAYRLPTYSPDYNPIEMLWKKIKEKYTHLHYFPDFEALKNKVNNALIEFKNLKKEILALFGLYERMNLVSS